MKYAPQNRDAGFFKAAQVNFDLDIEDTEDFYSSAVKFIKKNFDLGCPIEFLDSEEGKRMADETTYYTDIKSPDYFELMEVFQSFKWTMYDFHGDKRKNKEERKP